jgi:uncharacterized protein (DUF169 family)/NAD-dependent dihydropyrimidine dehydrogenase PreA subunit
MPFIIDQEVCAGCGSCVGNCPNRAIIMRGDRYFITSMCCDCGVCLEYCSTDAIKKGPVRAEFDNKKINAALKEKLSLKRDIVAMKFADKVPDNVRVEEGPTFWCAICGDIFDGQGDPVFFRGVASSCGGSKNVGIGSSKVMKEDFEMVINAQVVGEGNLYATKDLLAKNRTQFPRYPKVYGGMILASLDRLSRPDIILIPVNCRQMSMISTAYSFETGDLITGYAGKSTCLMSITFPFIENKPVFTPGDHGGRTFMRLQDDEMLLCFPYRLVPGLITNLDRTVYAQIKR